MSDEGTTNAATETAPDAGPAGEASATAAPRKPARPSYGKGLFSGKIDEGLVLPYPEPDPEESEALDMLLESLRRLGAQSIDPAGIDREKRIPDEVVRGLAELGVLGLAVEEEHGGFGFSRTAYARVLEELAGICASTAVLVGAHQSIGLKAITIFGTDEQKERYLPSLAAGEKLAAFALTEPNSGSDAGGIQATGVRSDDGATFVLDGRKQWITNGGLAEVFTVFAKTRPEGADEKKVSAFIVEKSRDGVSVGPEAGKLGIRGSSTTDLILEGVQLPAGNLLGEEGKGFKIAMEVLNEGRLGLAAGSLGGMKRVIADALEYARGRKQFGKSISEFEMIREKLARMVEDAYALESMVYLTTGLVDRGGVDFSLESAACKVFGSEAMWRCADEGLQIAGGYGYTTEFPFERYLRDARINLIFEGTNEIMRLFIALAGLQGPGEKLKDVARALKAPLTSIGFLSEFALERLKHTIAADRLEGVSKALEPEADGVARAVRDLDRLVNGGLREHRKGIIEKQMLLRRIADTFVRAYAMTAAISRTEAALAREGGGEAELTVCRSVCRRLSGGEPGDDLTLAVAETLARADRYPF